MGDLLASLNLCLLTANLTPHSKVRHTYVGSAQSWDWTVTADFCQPSKLHFPNENTI